MAFSEFESARIRKLVGAFIDARRPPAHIRSELDLGFRIGGQSVEIFEIRPLFGGAPGERIELPAAKATYVRASDAWKVYWQRADLKWHSYQPMPMVRTIEEFLETVDRDDHAAFFG